MGPKLSSKLSLFPNAIMVFALLLRLLSYADFFKKNIFLPAYHEGQTVWIPITPGLGHCFHRLSTDDSSRQRVNAVLCLARCWLKVNKFYNTCTQIADKPESV